MADHVGDEITFSTNFPLPYRVLALGGIGILGWATNLHGLNLLGIDAVSALELSTRQGHRGNTLSTASAQEQTTPLPTHNGWKLVAHPSNVYMPVYKLFVQYTCVAVLSWLLFHHATGGKYDSMDMFKFIPAVTMLCMFILLVCPFNMFEKRERDKFLYSIRRCLISQSHIYFADVVFADVFTSFAKVLGDVWLSVCILLPGTSLLSSPTQDGLARWILPTIMSLPYAVRFRQCLVEYMFPTNESKRPLYNAIKYATSFPVIFLSAAQRLAAVDTFAMQGAGGAHYWWNGHWLYKLWLMAAAVNSLYSFWWDVTFDWGFDLLRTRSKSENFDRQQSPPRPLVLPRLHSRSTLIGHRDSEELSKEALLLEEEQFQNTPPSERKRYPFGLRSTLLLPLAVYPFAILADLVLRMTWSVKLSSHLHAYAEGDRVIFLIEFAEMLRRWMWVFLRVEWEVVKEREVRAAMPPGTRMRRRAPDASIEDEYEMLAGHSSYGGDGGGAEG